MGLSGQQSSLVVLQTNGKETMSMGSISCCSFPVLIFDSISIKDVTSDGQAALKKQRLNGVPREFFVSILFHRLTQDTI
jgi:hypothetical protein